MKLDSEFYRLPLVFDVDRLVAEVGAVDESSWIPHPTGYAGNSSLPLISVEGELNEDFSGAMKATKHLEQFPYIKQVIGSFKEVFGRSRLMCLGPGAEVPEHCDTHYHWMTHIRIHIPIITFPEVQFFCGGKHVHMSPGEAWIFNSWAMHRVINPTDQKRIHLVLDTSGSSKFFDMLNKSDQPHRNIFNKDVEPMFLEYKENARVNIQTENHNMPIVMAPGEVDALCDDLIEDAFRFGNDPLVFNVYKQKLNMFKQDWRSIWSIHGQSETGWNIYRDLMNRTWLDVSRLGNMGLQSNDADAINVFHTRVISSCLNPAIRMHSTASTGQTTVSSSPQRQNSSKKVGRNDPCPCGSGKKYKKCHGSGI